MTGPTDATPLAADATLFDAMMRRLHQAVLLETLARLRADEGTDAAAIDWVLGRRRAFMWVVGATGLPMRVPVLSEDLPFSFESCCSACGLSPEQVRGALASHWRRAGRPRPTLA